MEGNGALSREEARVLFDSLDLNGDGKLSVKELSKTPFSQSHQSISMQGNTNRRMGGDNDSSDRAGRSGESKKMPDDALVKSLQQVCV